MATLSAQSSVRNCTTDVAIIGAGPVGLFVAYQLYLLNINSIIVDASSEVGGQCSQLYPDKYIYDIPGFKKITAQKLIDQLAEQCLTKRTSFVGKFKVANVERQDNGRFTISSADKSTVDAKAVVIATGGGEMTPRKLGLVNEAHYGNSIYYSVENPEIFADKKVLIAGGGDSAADWAMHLADIAKSVTLVHRRDSMRCAPASFAKIQQLCTEGKIDFKAFYKVSALHGAEELRSVDLISSKTAETLSVEADMALVLFGLQSNNSYLKQWGLKLDFIDQVEVEASTMETNIKGMFAIGDSCSYPGKLKLILTGFSEAAIAARNCYSYIHGKAARFSHSTDLKLD